MSCMSTENGVKTFIFKMYSFKKKIKKKNFLQLYCPNKISPMGNAGCFFWGEPAATESCYPPYCACWLF